MKTRIAMVLAVLFVIGFAVSVEAAEIKASSELSISSESQAPPSNCAKGCCPKKAESKKTDKAKSSCDKAKAGCDKSKADCDKAKTDGCPKKATKEKTGCSKSK